MNDPRLRQALGEWRQNRRLRLGAMAILLILGVQVAVSLSGRREATIGQYEQDALLLARIEQASRDDAWPARAAEVEARLTEVRESLPTARSDGLAQAELQAWLAGLAAGAGLQDVTIRVETSLAVPDQPGLWQVIARLDANVAPGRISALARTLATAPWVVAERIEIKSGTNSRVSLVVRGYFRQDEAGVAETTPLEGTMQ